MAVTCLDFLNSAVEFKGGGSEVSWRNAASRAYYAAYHACLPLAKSLPNYRDVQGGVHTQLIAALENATARDSTSHLSVRALGFLLRQIRFHRIAADYFIEEEFDESNADLVLKQSERIIESSQKLYGQNAASST